MSADSLIMQAINITAIGMLIVFSFLVLLILVVSSLGKFVQWAEKRWPAAVPAAANGADNAFIAVAIAAAKKLQGN